MNNTFESYCTLQSQEERESFSKQLLQRGFKDTFREMYPDVVAYTYWNYRTNARVPNRGWRLDYFLVRCPHLTPPLFRDYAFLAQATSL